MHDIIVLEMIKDLDKEVLINFTHVIPGADVIRKQVVSCVWPDVWNPVTPVIEKALPLDIVKVKRTTSPLKLASPSTDKQTVGVKRNIRSISDHSSGMCKRLLIAGMSDGR